jgi:hypothetical protein
MNMSTEITPQLMIALGKAIEGTFLAEILNIKSGDLIEPKMPLGSGEVKGPMTEFEKQCFTMQDALWKRLQVLVYERRIKKFKNQEQKNQADLDFLLDEASDQKVRAAQLSFDTKDYLDQMIYKLHIKELKIRLEAVNGILRTTIMDRLKLKLGDNVRHYLCTGYRIASETDIKDKPKPEPETTEKAVAMLNGTAADDGKSSITENLCVLF